MVNKTEKVSQKEMNTQECQCISLKGKLLMLGVLSCLIYLGFSILLVNKIIGLNNDILINDKTNNIDNILLKYKALYSGLLTFLIIMIIISIIFIIGVQKRNRNLMIPYLATNFTIIIIVIPISIIFCVYLCSVGTCSGWEIPLILPEFISFLGLLFSLLGLTYFYCKKFVTEKNYSIPNLKI